MKKNKILILIIILLLSGCTTEYNLVIDNDNFIESIDVVVDNEDSDEVNKLTNENLYISSTTTNDLLYDKTIDDDSIKTTFNYKHSFSYDEFRGTLEKKCFNNIKLTEYNGVYTLNAEDFKCYKGYEQYADSYKINIKTKNNVLFNNADEVKNNIYTWKIDESNYKNKNIIIQYTKQKQKVPLFNYIKPVIISIIISVVILFLLIKNNKFIINNR